MRGSMQKQAFRFFRIIRRPRVPRMTPGTGTRHKEFIASTSCQQVPRSYCCMKRVTPLESSHGHHLPTRAVSPRAARGRFFDPKRAATAPGCRACSANPEHRVGSRLIVGQDQTQDHSNSSMRGSSTTPGPDDGSHIRPRCCTESS